MPTTSLTPANIRFIKANRLTMSGSDMALRFGVGKGVVQTYMRNNNLQPPAEIKNKFRAEGIRRKFDPKSKENKFIKKHYLKVPLKRLGVMMGHTESFVYGRLKRLGLSVPPDIVAQRKLDSQIKPGNVPANKGKKMSKAAYKKCKATMFKKGQIPHNAIGFKDGDISIRQRHPKQGGRSYKWIREGLGKWQLLHIHNWEKKHKKKLPKGHCLWFKDNDTMNCKPSNLELITRAENLKRNRSNFLSLPEDVRQASTLIKKLNKAINGKEQTK